MKPKFILFVLYCVVFACLPLINQIPVINALPLSSLPKLEKGDWVFRQGTSLDSTLIHLLGRGQFSHIGIVIETEPNILILHATTDDMPEQPNQVIVSSTAHFFRHDLAQKIAIVRPHFLTKNQKQTVIDLLQKEIGAPFILDEKEKPHRYCTTLIEHAIKHVYPNFNPQWQAINMPFFQGRYLFPDAFFHYPKTELIYTFDNPN